MESGAVDSTMTTVVILDDHPAIVDGVAGWCAAADPPIRVLDSSDRLTAAFVEPGRSADVVVLDLQLSSAGPAFDNLTQLVDAGRRVIVYSQHAEHATVLRCLDLGAATYLTKAEGQEHLIPALRAVSVDLPYTTPTVVAAMITDRRPRRPRLSERELAVLKAWFACESRKLVAQRLHLSVSSVSTYIDRVRVKYANVGRPATTMTNLVGRALEDGLITAEDLEEAEKPPA